MKFNELQLTKETFDGIEAAGFETCTPVQAKVFTHSLLGKDVMVQSQTGTGKTAAFLITVFERFIKSPEDAKSKALIIVPTRELAVQIKQDALLLARGIPGIRIETFFGGVGYKEQDEAIKKGTDVFIGTPGRLLDYEKLHKIDFSAMDMIVVDEADRLFDMGFYPDIRDMFQKFRRRDDRQTLLFSATLTTRARNLAWDFMNGPVEIEIEPELMTVAEITQGLFHVSKTEKFGMLLRILNKEKPENAIIFTNTKSMAVEISKRLELNGYEAHVLMGDLPQQKRLQVINKMKKGEIKFLVATDVAARGLHVDDLELVINYDIPDDFENYVHRVGRTARAGKSGIAITLACEQFVYGLEAVEEYIQMKIPVIWADEETYPQIRDKSAHLRFRDLVKSYSSGGSDRRRDSSGRSDHRRDSSGRSKNPGQRLSPQGRKPAGRSAAPRRNPAGNKPVTEPDPRTVQSRPAQRPASSPRGSAAPGETRAKRPQRPQRSSSQAATEQMSFEDRLAIYKNKYGAELETESKPSGTEAARPASGKRPSRQRKRAPRGEGNNAQRPAGGQRAPQGEGRTAQRPAGGQRTPQGEGRTAQRPA
ncbi:MAG: DEAD/DEAH box helicase, partial [Spirochaetia bacterium]|nr:DEAD/DEAH box helicase [Spirochaetia bacterium]